jgi:hypothetical protein
MDAEQFSKRYLNSVVADGVARTRSIPQTGEPYESLDFALSEPAVSPADFLLGREPNWGDINAGFAIERSFEAELHEAAIDVGQRIVLLTGTAGSGKSTSLRRLALALQAEGKKVKWLRFEASEAVSKLRTIGLASDAEVIVIDRCERFGEYGTELIRGLSDAERGIKVIAGYASGPFDENRVSDALQDVDPAVLSVPNLDDSDIDRLVDALTRANRLGKLAGLPFEMQCDRIRAHSDRQLLVAMLEATSGERFEDKIVHECENLASDLTTTYAVVALATSHRYSLGVDDLLGALSDVSSGGLELIDRLIRQQLILRLSDSTLVARHPVIAREVVSHYRRSGQLSEAIARLAFVMASKFYVVASPCFFQSVYDSASTFQLSGDRMTQAMKDPAF